MTRFVKASVPAASLALALTQLVLSGCALTVPLDGTPETSRHDQAEFSDNTLVTVGPRRLLEYLARRIAESDPELEIVDALLFRDTAFPQGGWQLHALLDTTRRNSLAQQLQVDYLVLITPLVYTVGNDSGFFVPLVAGAQSAEHKSNLSATIYDLKAGTVLCRIDSAATGKERVYSYVVLFTGTTPHVVTPVLNALVAEIVKALGSAKPLPHSRIAILATESPPPPP